MSWVNDLCKSIKSKCWCWCQCICCPNGDVHTDNDEDKLDVPSSMSSSRLENKIKDFYNSLPNTPCEEKNAYFIDKRVNQGHTSKLQESQHQNGHTHEEKSDILPVPPSMK